ncbi:MAG: hypothetical protein RIS43_180 [Actinomycetota bacterium]
MSDVLWRGSAKNRLLAYFVTALSGVLTIVVLFTNQYASPEKQIVGAGWIPFFIVMAVLPVVGFVFSELHVLVQSDGVVVGFGPTGWPKRIIKWQYIALVEVIDVRPTEWGGWGYRWVPWKRATAAVMRAGTGLHFELGSGKHFVVTVDDADKALASIRTAMHKPMPRGKH